MPTPIDYEARYAALQARMDAVAARRHAGRQQVAAARNAARESQLRAAVGAAVREVLARTMVSEVAPTADAPVAEAAVATVPAEPRRPLHEMSPEEFRAHARDAFDQQARDSGVPLWHAREPLTISQYIAHGSSGTGGTVV